MLERDHMHFHTHRHMHMLTHRHRRTHTSKRVRTGNWIGSVLMAAAVASSGVFSTNSIPLVIAAAKTSMGWQATFIRAVLCNCELT